MPPNTQIRKSEINVAGPDILLHHKLINYEINMQSVDMTLGLEELAVQCNDLSALYYDLYYICIPLPIMYCNIETENRLSIVL